jgi:flagellar protein FlbD
MISVTNLNNTEVIINSDLIEYIKATPDTTISMTTGRKIIAKESVNEVIDRVIQFKKKLI